MVESMRSVVPCTSIDTHDTLTLVARFMGPTWERQGPGGPHVGPMNLAIWGANVGSDQPIPPNP